MSTLSVSNLSTLSGEDVFVKSSFEGGFNFRNKIINGDMRIDQRNDGAAVTITGTNTTTYVLDRFYARSVSDTGSKISVQRSTVAPAGFNNSLLITSLTSYTPGVSDTFGIIQAIEGFNIGDLGWGTENAQPITLSFKVRSSLTGTFGGFIANKAVDRCYLFSYTINSANTFEDKTITIPGDITGTWLTNNDVGLFVSFSVGVGSNQTGSAGSWSSTFLRSVTGQTSLVGTNGATFYITGVQLEVGSVATPFERRPIGAELSLCQRYYEIRKSASNALFTAFFYIVAITATTYRGALTFSEKRTSPTITFSGSATFNGGVSPTSYGFQNITTNTALIAGNNNSTTTGLGSVVISNNNGTTFLSFDAEL
jgi:hypothetical protein